MERKKNLFLTSAPWSLSQSYVLGRVRAGSSKRTASQASHAAAMSNLTCRNCGKMFAYSFNMVRHRRQCEGRYHLQCAVCGRQFHRRDLYADHLKMAHGLQDTKRDSYMS
ncbi:hypothetical protein ACOMHN_036012 [Nucella lapillus]